MPQDRPLTARSTLRPSPHGIVPDCGAATPAGAVRILQFSPPIPTAQAGLPNRIVLADVCVGALMPGDQTPGVSSTSNWPADHPATKVFPSKVTSSETPRSSTLITTKPGWTWSSCAAPKKGIGEPTIRAAHPDLEKYLVPRGRRCAGKRQ